MNCIHIVAIHPTYPVPGLWFGYDSNNNVMIQIEKGELAFAIQLSSDIMSQN